MSSLGKAVVDLVVPVESFVQEEADKQKDITPECGKVWGNPANFIFSAPDPVAAEDDEPNSWITLGDEYEIYNGKEIARTLEKKRVENPENRNQWVEVETIKDITFDCGTKVSKSQESVEAFGPVAVVRDVYTHTHTYYKWSMPELHGVDHEQKRGNEAPKGDELTDEEKKNPASPTIREEEGDKEPVDPSDKGEKVDLGPYQTVVDWNFGTPALFIGVDTGEHDLPNELGSQYCSTGGYVRYAGLRLYGAMVRDEESEAITFQSITSPTVSGSGLSDDEVGDWLYPDDGLGYIFLPGGEDSGGYINGPIEDIATTIFGTERETHYAETYVVNIAQMFEDEFLPANAVALVFEIRAYNWCGYFEMFQPVGINPPTDTMPSWAYYFNEVDDWQAFYDYESSITDGGAYETTFPEYPEWPDRQERTRYRPPNPMTMMGGNPDLDDPTEPFAEGTGDVFFDSVPYNGGSAGSWSPIGKTYVTVPMNELFGDLVITYSPTPPA